MKITFDDKSYVECKKSDQPGKVIIVISAKNHDNPLRKTVNAVEINVNDFKKLISDIQI